jgi:hypothetical protein
MTGDDPDAPFEEAALEPRETGVGGGSGNAGRLSIA